MCSGVTIAVIQSDYFTYKCNMAMADDHVTIFLQVLFLKSNNLTNVSGLRTCNWMPTYLPFLLIITRIRVDFCYQFP